MSRLDVFAAVEVGDGAGDFEDSVVGASRESEAVHGVFQDVAARLVQVAVFLDELRGHLRTGMDGWIFRITFLLNFPSLDDTFAYYRARLATALGR